MDIYEFHDEEDEEEREIKKDIERISQERDDIYDFNEDEEFHELNDNGLDSQNIGEQVFNQEEQPANVVFRESNCSDEILKEVPQQATEDETSPRVKQEEDADESINGDLHSEISCNDSITAEIHEEHDSIDIKLDNLNEIKSDDLLNVDKDVDKKPADVQELSVSLYHRSLSKEAGDNVNSPVEEVPEASNVKDEPEDNDVNSIQPMSDVTIEEQCKLPSADKCCDRVPSSGETGLDENHNNELEPEPDRHENCLLESSNFCEEVDECVEKTIGDLIGELEERAMNRASARMAENSMGCAHSKDEHLHDAAFLGPNCTDLMDELEEMCHGIMNGRLKNYDHGSKSDLTDLYNYVPTSIDDDVSTHINESKPVICDDTHVKDIKPSNSKAETKADSPINLVVQEKVTNDLLKLENDGTQLKNCELESLDLLWRLPEGTTIHHSKVPVPSEEARPAHLHSSKNNPLLNIPKLNLYKTFVPEQEEPLNLGKPKPKEEPVVKEKHQHQNVPRAVNKTEEQPVNSLLHNSPKQVKQDKNVNDTSSKLLELLTNEEKVDPLAQLKEVLSDPNLAVPDPLLVPRERLSALIANPAKEIPRLLAQKQEVKYPKFDTDLLVVSLTHLQMMLQSSGKDEDMRLYQQHAQMLQSQLNTGKECSLDPATASMINQMLWLPYLEQLQLARSTNPQEFLAMLNNVVGYPPYSPQWTQQGYEYAQHQQMLSLWQDMMQKPNLSVPPSLSKSYNDLYKANSQTSLLPGYGQVRSNKLPPSQMTPAAATAAASARAAYPRSADVPYTSSRRPSKSSRHHSHHGMNSYLQRQQSWPMTQCTPSMIPPNSNDISRLQQANINNPYLSHSSSVKHGTQAHPSLISANAPSAASVATSSSSSVSSLLHQAVNYHDTTITPAASSTTISSANSSSSLPKLKVRDFGVDPSRRPNNLLKFGEPHFAHPGAKFPDANHPNLWHPLFSR
ncbi:hypothetical protein O3M35_001107 [Rhynocoris fuscipes]|uniref:Uncharacterized protein n=1 Tax=Rhynocoris fuscipes TaxID=488301 RepID=A0AAW1DTX7_9HEMI